MHEHKVLTQAELVALLKERFGNDPMDWAFQCPQCGDIATGRDFREALAANPDPRRDKTVSDLLGQQCIGRTLGALRVGSNEAWRRKGGRGCDWTAYGLFAGPWQVQVPPRKPGVLTVLAKECTTCKAVAGQHCRTKSGRKSEILHRARWEAATEETRTIWCFPVAPAETEQRTA